MSTGRLGTTALAVACLLPRGIQAQATRLPAEDVSIEASVDLLFEVGAMDGPEWASYGQVSAVAFDSESKLYVLDGMNQRVIVLDGEGQHVRTFGRQGGGPGEFESPQGLTVLADGTVVVYDGARRNYSLLQADGTFVSSVATDIMADAAIPMGRLRPGGGGFLAEYRGMDVDTGDPATSSEGGGSLLVKFFPLEGGPGETLVNARNAGGRARMVSRPGEMSVRLNPGPAFTAVFDWGVLPDGRVAFVDSDRYEVTVGARGGELSVMERPFEPWTTTDRDRRDERARRLEAMEERGEGVPQYVEVENGVRRTRRDLEAGRRMLEQLEFADTRPVLSELAVDHMGRIWVRRTGERVAESGPVDVLAPDGRYLGSLTGWQSLPDAFGPDGRAVFVETGEFGVQSVRVVRVRLDVAATGAPNTGVPAGS